MSKHIIWVRGCDGSTAVPMDLTDAELATVKKLADAVNAAATYGCKPNIDIDPKYPSWDEAVAEYTEDLEEMESRDATT